ncbi:MAG: signal peptidase I [Bacteroidales bacterium]|nr:signal peptidase I [Bacteroidales bacterium]
MADNKEKVVKTTKTETVSKDGDKTIKTVTTTTTTTSKKKKGWGGLKTWVKTLIILGGVLLVVNVLIFFTIGKVKVSSNSMDPSYKLGSVVFYSKLSNPDFNDVVVFRHPERDTINPQSIDKNYYTMCRKFGNWCSKSELIFQPLDNREVYLSRVIGLPGQIVQIKNNVVFINKNKINDVENSKYAYLVVNNGILNPTSLDSIGLTKEGMSVGEDIFAERYLEYFSNKISNNESMTIYSLTASAADKLSKFAVIKDVERIVLPTDFFDRTFYPYSESKHWNFSNFGPVAIPQKDKSIPLNPNTILLYRRCIEVYEGKKVEVKDNKVYINDKQVDSYKFERNYYFVISDNHASSNDSRYFGFLPDNHVLGVAL